MCRTPKTDTAKGSHRRFGDVVAIVRAKGMRYVLEYPNLWYYVYRRTRGRRTFTCDAKAHRYLIHRYNKTWRNERCVEIPIVLSHLAEAGEGPVLEVGNVLSHYVPVHHDILDKYERSPSVVNQDILEFEPDHEYDLILAVSTLEHVGWDEAKYGSGETGSPANREKLETAFARLVSWLSPRGKLVVTVPKGYNSALDQLLDERALPFTRCHALKRLSYGHTWTEVSPEELKGVRYNHPYPTANGLIVGIVEK
jgi:hypothetical protein